MEKTAVSLFGWYEGQEKYQDLAKKLLDAGLRVCISTDNMTLAAVTLEDEYRHCVADMGFAPDDLRTMARFALDAAFLPEQEKRKLAGKF